MTPDAIDEFWRWFQKNLHVLNSLSDPDTPFWDTALSQLQQVDGRLWFEMSKPDGGIREFIITAQGEREVFPLVDAIVARAPAITAWRFMALKPSMGFDFKTTYEGLTFDPRAMWFLPLQSNLRPQNLGLRVGVPSLTPETQRQADNAVLIILDTALGERSAAFDIQHVEVCALPETPADAGYIELCELARYLEWHKRKLRDITIGIATFALIEDYFGMEWVEFVDQITRLSKGVAFYCASGDLANCVMESYLSGKKKKTYIA